MGDFLFAVKAMIATIAIVFLMQIKVGPATIEQLAHEFIRTSAITDYLRTVAAGGVKALGAGVDAASAMFDTNVDQSLNKASKAESNPSFFSFRRSDASYREREKKRRVEEDSPVDGRADDESHDGSHDEFYDAID